MDMYQDSMFKAFYTTLSHLDKLINSFHYRPILLVVISAYILTVGTTHIILCRF